MALSHLLDTSVFCQPIKDYPSPTVLTNWSELGDTAVCTSAVCLAEILQGLEIRDSKKYWRRYRKLLSGFYPVLPLDEPIAELFGKFAAGFRKAGSTRPALDLFIAATARHYDLIIATLNPKHFIGIPGVRVEHWSK